MLKGLLDKLFYKMGYVSQKVLEDQKIMHNKEVADLSSNIYSSGIVIGFLRRKEETLFYISDLFHNKEGRDKFSSDELDEIFMKARLYTDQYRGVSECKDIDELNSFNNFLTSEAWEKVYKNCGVDFLRDSHNMKKQEGVFCDSRV